MQKHKSTMFTLFLAFALFVFPRISFSQEIIDVPPSWGDEGTDNVLTRFIMSDTTDSGERAHPNCIYRLKRGEYYEVNPTIRLDFNFTLVGESEPANVRPAMIIRGVDAQGSYVTTFFNIVGDSINVTFKHLIIQGVQDDNKITTQGVNFLGIYGKYNRIVLDSCVANGITAYLLRGADSERCTYIMRNSVVRNTVPLNQYFNGVVYFASNKTTHQDTMLFVNNTFFNIQLRVLRTKSYTDLIEFTHNTFLQTTTKALQMNWAHNVVVNDNIFYDYMSVGTRDKDLMGDGDLQSIVKVYKSYPEHLLDYGYTEADRRVIYNNNVYAWSPGLTKYWKDYVPQPGNYYDEPVHLIPWMCDSTRINFFENHDEYPLFEAVNNDSLDPGFGQEMIDSVLRKQLAYLDIYRVKGYSDLSQAKERFYAPGGDFFEIPWPLPETQAMAYTNPAVLKHAEGGFPAGDLNWFPEKLKEWKKWVTGVEKTETTTVPSLYTLSQNYPNPFNPTTEINFSLPVAGNTTLTVYNALGEKVATLINQQLSAGSYKYQFDASKLSSGVYFYKLKSNDYSEVKKMMLIK